MTRTMFRRPSRVLAPLCAGLFIGCASAPPPAPPAPAPETTVEITVEKQPKTPARPSAEPQVLAFPKEPFRDKQPDGGEPRAFQLPGIKTFKLPQQNIDVFLVERHTLPTVSIALTFDGGSVNDPAGKEGLASVCMSMLEEGTQRLGKLAFEEALADLASGVNAFANTEEQGVSMHTLTRSLDETLDLFVEMMRQPGFRQEDLDRLVARRLEALKQSKATVAAVAGRVRGVVTHGPAHGFGRLATETSYGAITTADCQKYHTTWVKPGGARLFVVGDIDEKTVREKLGAKIADWKGKAPKSKSMGTPKGLAGRIFFVPIEGSAQSSVWLYHLGPKRNAPDYFATYLVDRILGGSFSSRINMNLREDKGWAYGARGGFSYDRQGSTFFAGASVQTEFTTESLLELHKDVLAMKTQSRPIGAAELDREKQGSILALPGRFATARETLAMYQELIRFKLPLDYWNGYVPGIKKVATGDVAKAAGKHLRPGELVALVVGDPARVMPGLLRLTAEQKLGKGELVVMDADGKVEERIAAVTAQKKVAELPPPVEKPAEKQAPPTPGAPTSSVGGSGSGAAAR